MLNRADVIQKIVDATGARTYLEIGLHHSETFLTVNAERKIGVDPERPSPRLVNAASQALSNALTNLPEDATIDLDIGNTPLQTYLGVKTSGEGARSFNSPINGASIQTLQMTSDELFAKRDDLFSVDKIDVAFVDGLHEWRQAARDVENCLRRLNEGGVVVMHDCSPTTAMVATPLDQLEEAKKSPEWTGAWTGDVWKAVAWLRSTRDNLRIFVLDCDWGVGVVTKGEPNGMLDYTYEQVESLPFRDFELNRRHILDLRHESYIDEFAATLREREVAAAL